jgi:hypothetical protein
MPLAAATLQVACLILGSAPASGAPKAHGTFHPAPGVTSSPALGLPVRDKVFLRTPKRVARATTSATEHVYSTPDGAHVFITRSDGYSPDPAADQALANFLGSRLHNFELDGLHVYVATPAEVPDLCGATAAACYIIQRQLMIVVGEASFGGLPTDYVVTHEYGHHIENHRRNPPFRGGPLLWGPKAWASYEGICPGVLRGRYSLSTATDDDYFRNPGEAFAEAYAYYHYPGLVPWEWDSSLQPNQASFNQIRLDVQQPWNGPQRLFRSGSVARGGDRVDRLGFTTPLDGTLTVDLFGPRQSDLDLFLIRARRRHVLKKSIGRGSRESFHFIVCGGFKFVAVVPAFKGGGHYRVRIMRP